MSVVSDRVVSVGRWEKLLEDTLRMPSVNGANTVRVQTSGECQRCLTMLMPYQNLPVCSSNVF